MKLFSVSIGLLLAALGVFFVPVSFSVDGFGLVVNPSGVRTVRAAESGIVLHFPSDDGRFFPGQIVTGVIYTDAVAKNALLAGTLRREFAKIDSDHLDKTSKLRLDLERDRAKRDATSERLAARSRLTEDTAAMLAALQSFTEVSEADIAILNEERLEQLSRLEDLVKRSGEVSALPAQRLATMLESIQSDRLSIISSERTQFSTEKMVLDMIKGLNDLSYSNAIDAAEIVILTNRLDNLAEQIRELDALRATQRSEAEARYLAKSVLPQVAVSHGLSIDMRTLQATRADVSRADPLRLLATESEVAGLSMLIYGAPVTGDVRLRHGRREIAFGLPSQDPDAIAQAMREGGLEVVAVHEDTKTLGAIDVTSLFIEFAEKPSERLTIVSSEAKDAQDLPVLVTASVSVPDEFGAETDAETTNEIIGFLENRHAVVLKPGQRVRGSISDTRTGAEIVFEARLLDRDYATVDTKELGIRLGNQSLADKIIKRGVLSQVVVGVSSASAQQIAHLPGAIVHLSFPLARQSLFSFLLARNAAI